MQLTRRDLGKLAMAAVPGAAVLAPWRALGQRAAKPNSKVAGVQIGLNVPYNFGGRDMNPDEQLERILKLNISAIEMRSQPVETFLGSPAANGQKADADQMRKFRASVAMDRVAAFRKKYKDAGVLIDIVKYDGIYIMSDAEVDYCFNLARTLGARGISCEIDARHTERIGQFADKHKLPVAYHGHAATTPEHWEAAFKQARYNWANLDLGHFVAGNNTSPVPFLKQHHARITHVHVKDRKLKEGPVTPFGEGDTPIVEALRLIRDNKWPIQATIEFEYPVPAGSDRMAELVKTIDYCRRALAS
ncbi:MAG: sugar phosphate isomerase/epimerase [Vicinamibacterales bacterium]